MSKTGHRTTRFTLCKEMKDQVKAICQKQETIKSDQPGLKRTTSTNKNTTKLKSKMKRK